MTTRPRIRRTRLVPPAGSGPAAAPDDALFEPQDDGFAEVPPLAADPEIAAIEAEALTGRQLRTARRIAARHGFVVASDAEAVKVLRRNGIDPFQRATMLELVDQPEAKVQLPQRRETPNLPAERPAPPAPAFPPSDATRMLEIARIQRDLARRRRRRSFFLALRLFVFVTLPTIAAGLYYARIATPLYATKSEFVIEQAEPQGAASLGGLFSGTSFAGSKDSITVQSYLNSRDAMLRLDRDLGFKAHFSQSTIDPLERLAPDASNEAAYRLYKRMIRIGYDPTEGLIKMEVIAADPEVSEAFSKALISYAEAQVDQMTQRLRGDHMEGARESYADAEAKMLGAQSRVVELQQKYKVLSGDVEVGLLTSQITALDTQLSQERLALREMRSNAAPTQARVAPAERRVAALEDEIAGLRAKLTEDSGDGLSLAQIQSELLVAQADVATRQLLLSQSLQQMETARIEANRQTRYLEMGVSPVAPDEATYPRAFENTAVAFLCFAGLYLMLSMTASVLREQVSA